MALEKIREVGGRAVYVPGDDIDTDQIIPARFLICVTFDALGGQLMHDVRFEADGSPKPHPLNNARYAGASVLLSGRNFGCGSSREHAPQSLHKAGFRAIVAESFAEIFFGNSTTLGLVCATLTRAQLGELAKAVEANPSLEVQVDVAAREVRAGKLCFACGLPDSARDALVRGEWDPITQLLETRDEVTALHDRLPYTQW